MSPSATASPAAPTSGPSGSPGRAWSRSKLLAEIWGDENSVEERTVDVHIRRLRKALEPSGHARYVQTVRGHGYRFSDVV